MRSQNVTAKMMSVLVSVQVGDYLFVDENLSECHHFSIVWKEGDDIPKLRMYDTNDGVIATIEGVKKDD